MTTKEKLLAVLLLIPLGFPVAAWGQTGLASSRHDFTDDATVAGGVGLCTFCHTPHSAQETKLLWNHTASAETYTWSDLTETTGGTPLTGFDQNWGGVSKNCLSCHDGTVAIGDVAWFRAAAPATPLFADKHDQLTDPYKLTGKLGGGDGDLAGNHPVAVPFPFQSAANTYNSITSGAQAVLSGWVADPETLGIRLFHDIGGGSVAGAVAGSTGIECSSCHDPHNGSQVLDSYFLRGTLTGNDANYICLKCHQK